MAESSEEYLANLTNDEGEVRELTEEDFKQFKPLSAFPNLQRRLTSLKRPEPAPTLTVTLPSDVITPFRAKGDGWELRVEAALRDWLRDHAA